MLTALILCVVGLRMLVPSAQADDVHEPKVAFLCSHPAMYLTEDGWVKDDTSGCLRDPTDILSYCRKVFPSLDVRNVVESNQKETIQNWCSFGQTTCNHQYTVTPYRCLVGPFQSDALLVPELCIFDHIHNSSLCTSYTEWNKTSVESCTGRSMVQQSFAMLQPCGIDRFNGVEFVCCPPQKEKREKSGRPTKVADGSKKSTQTEKPKTKNDAFTEYVNQATGGHKWNEHEYYMKAKGDMRAHHRDKVAKMMKDWSAARQRVQDLKAIDSKASEKLNKEITSRFQKMYEAEEVESEMEKKQLAMLHQQRVQADLNEKKQKALDNYMDVVEDYDADSSEILKALKHYIKSLQKDRLHTINRYKHMQETDPAEADVTRPHMAEHIKSVDQQLEEALAMLDRLPKFKNKIRNQIDDYLDSYHSIDASVSALLSPSAKVEPTPAKEEKPAEDDYNAEEDYEDEKSEEDSVKDGKPEAVEGKKEEEEEEEEEIDSDCMNNSF